MKRPDVLAGIICDAAMDETVEIVKKIAMVGGQQPDATDDTHCTQLALIERIDIAPGDICITISAERLADLLGMDQSRVVEDFLKIASPFQHRKRGVETKLIIGDEPADIDETLLRNIGHAHRYFDQIRSGKTFGEIAETEGVSKRRIQQLTELAFLAPDIVREVRDGKQPVSLTSDWLMRHAFSPIWSEQRDQFAAL